MKWDEIGMGGSGFFAGDDRLFGRRIKNMNSIASETLFADRFLTQQLRFIRAYTSLVESGR